MNSDLNERLKQYQRDYYTLKNSLFSQYKE